LPSFIYDINLGQNPTIEYTKSDIKVTKSDKQSVVARIVRQVRSHAFATITDTPRRVGDPSVLPDLLYQIDTPISRFMSDGAYDGAPANDMLKTLLGEAVEIIIPPPMNVVPSLKFK